MEYTYHQNYLISKYVLNILSTTTIGACIGLIMEIILDVNKNIFGVITLTVTFISFFYSIGMLN